MPVRAEEEEAGETPENTEEQQSNPAHRVAR
jgi:hypothetical protein